MVLKQNLKVTILNNKNMKKNTVYTLVVAILVIATVFNVSCKDDETGNLEGTITDSQTSQPVSGVNVTISPGNSSYTTGADGKYSFSGLNQGDYTVQASKSGYVTNTKEVAVFAGDTRKWDIVITPLVPILSVNLTSLDFGSNLTTLPI